ncbi:MAG: hypothetical protein AAB402_02525 [Patescibacteria group bacterium]
MKWLISLIVIAVGAFMVIKTQWIYDFTGPIDWAEQHLGTEGGTRLFIKLLGVLLILGAFLGVTGILGNWVLAIFGGFAQSSSVQ